MENNLKRTFITCDGYQFEVNTMGKLTESEFLYGAKNSDGTIRIRGYENMPNLNAKNAHKQIVKAYNKLLKTIA